MSDAALQLSIRPGTAGGVRILCAGDLCLPEAEAGEGGYDLSDWCSPGLGELLGGKDFSIVGLECAMVAGELVQAKAGPRILGSRQNLEVIRGGGFDAVSLANNHILDQGAGGLMGTIGLCVEAGLRTVGAGRNVKEACLPLGVEIGGVRIGFLAFSQEEFCCATADSAGAARLDPLDCAPAIRAAREGADVVIVLAHGGNEFYSLPSPRTRAWYRFLVECGAHAVIGSHPHAVQSAEVYHGAVIVYSLGNFVFPFHRAVPPCFYTGALAVMRIDRQGVISCDLFGHRFGSAGRGLRAELLDGEALETLRADLAEGSAIVQDDEALEGLWKCFCHRRRATYLEHWSAGMGLRGGEAGRLVRRGWHSRSAHYFSLGLAQWLAGRTMPGRARARDVADFCNLIRCPAHADVLRTLAEMEGRGERPSREAWERFLRINRNGR